jgi:sulfate adenylyltransferase
MADLSLNRNQYLEFEKIGLSAFAPLDGFMNEDAFVAVVDEMRLPGGEPFPLPVVLDVDVDDAERLRGSHKINLSFDGIEVGTLSFESLFTCNKEAVALKVYGTTDPAHPGVAHFMNMGVWFIGGKIELKQRAALNISEDELTPAETRALFAERGWEKIAGFQTRNVPHRAHEHLQRIALDMVDGLFIQPLVGRKKKGDYTPDAILAGYRALIDGFYRKDCVLLGILSTSMRYAGPREAVFHAIIRRNYGCTHFIVGRDHAGVGNYYEKYAAHELTRRFDGELGIEIMRLHGPYFCRICDGIVTEHTCPHSDDSTAVSQISGSDMRAILLDGKRPDPNLMRPAIVEQLKHVPLFIENDE